MDHAVDLSGYNASDHARRPYSRAWAGFLIAALVALATPARAETAAVSCTNTSGGYKYSETYTVIIDYARSDVSMMYANGNIGPYAAQIDASMIAWRDQEGFGYTLSRINGELVESAPNGTLMHRDHCESTKSPQPKF